MRPQRQRLVRRLMWLVPLTVAAILLIAVPFLGWSHVGPFSGDEAKEDAQRQAHATSLRLRSSMTDNELLAAFARTRATVVQISRSDSSTTAYARIEGEEVGVLGMSSEFICFKFVIPADGNERVTYQEQPRCPGSRLDRPSTTVS